MDDVIKSLRGLSLEFVGDGCMFFVCVGGGGGSCGDSFRFSWIFRTLFFLRGVSGVIVLVVGSQKRGVDFRAPKIILIRVDVRLFYLCALRPYTAEQSSAVL